MMASPNLPLPLALQNLIESGFWPTTEKEELAQNLKPLVSSSQIRLFAPEQNDIFFYHPPFDLVSDCIRHGEEFWSWPMSASHEINHDLTLLIGDFGLGSDAPFALDYSQNIAIPKIIRLKWGQRKNGQPDNHWVEMAPDFEAFCQIIFG